MHTVRTDPVIKKCEDCGRPFRTYVPETYCELPGGGSVFYCDPQTKCPLCDDNGYGDFMNEDLFPELVPELRPNMSPSTLEPETSWVPNTSDTYCESSFSTQYDYMMGWSSFAIHLKQKTPLLQTLKVTLLQTPLLPTLKVKFVIWKFTFCEY